MTRLVVVGNGMVGARFVEDLLAADHAGRFRRHRPRRRGVRALQPRPAQRGRRRAVRRVDADPAARRRTTGSWCSAACRPPRSTARTGPSSPPTAAGTATTQLVLATGSSARIPPLAGLAGAPGVLPRGVHPLRTIDDAREIVAATLNARRAVVLGAGVLGLEAASGLTQRGCDVTVVHPAAGLMERQLDAGASRVVESAMTGLGISTTASGSAPRRSSSRTGPCAACGSATARSSAPSCSSSPRAPPPTPPWPPRPACPPTAACSSDAALASVGDRRVFAVGDCAQPPEGGTGLVAQGWEQSRRLAATLCGAGPLPAPGPASGATTSSG